MDHGTTRPGDGWRKSRRSYANGNCVEVGDWRTPTCDGGQCAEVGTTTGGVVVRDTTDRDGTRLAFTAAAWTRFTAAVKL